MRVGNSEATTMQQQIKEKDRRSSTSSSRGVEENTSTASAAEWSAELERVADKFDKIDDDQHNAATVATAIQPLVETFAALVPQLTRASDLVREELQVIRAKEDGDLLRERFGRQFDEYKQAKMSLKMLEIAHEEHSENATNLADELQCVTDNLDRMKTSLDGEASMVSDASPLAEIRAAIQRLRKENKELDIYLGVLDYELTQARISSLQPQQEHNLSNEDGSEEDEH